jgi:hypothetical protein
VSVPFVAKHPRERFCSAECKAENRKWRCWRAQQTYRRTEGGRQRRREQHSRSRVRVKERQAQSPETIAVIPDVPILTEMLSDSASAVATGDLPAVSVDGKQGGCQCCGPPSESPAVDIFVPPEDAREGHQYDPDSGKSCCLRPGCYVRFTATTRSPQQCFCSSACRKALRRVRLRELWWFRRSGAVAGRFGSVPEPPD